MPACPIIRDAEIEQLLREYTNPILRAAGLGKQNIQVVLIADKSFNAFVADARRIFVNVGALMESTDAEPDHRRARARDRPHRRRPSVETARAARLAQTAAIIAMILGMGAMVAGGGRDSGAAQAGAATLHGSQEVIRRTLLSYQRQHEDQADRAGVQFLTATGQSAKGMYETFKRFSDQVLYSARNTDPYLQSHPMPAERVAALEGVARQSPYWDKKDSPEMQVRHDMMRAKLYGFMERPDVVARRYPQTDQSLPARYARAISAYRHSRSARRHHADRRADRRAAEQSLFPRIEGSGAGGKRPRRRSDRAAAQGRLARAAAGLDPDHARPGSGRDRTIRKMPTKRSPCCATR